MDVVDEWLIGDFFDVVGRKYTLFASENTLIPAVLNLKLKHIY